MIERERRGSLKKKTSTLTSAEKYKLAKDKTHKLTTLLTTHMFVHENNNLVNKTDFLIKQVPKSYAAYCYNVFSETLYHFEIMRLYCFWDGDDENSNSIPAVIKLVDNKNVQEEIFKDRLEFQKDLCEKTNFLNPHTDPEVQKAIEKEAYERCLKEGEAQTLKNLKNLGSVIQAVRCIRNSKLLKSVKVARTQFIAHNLEYIRGEISAEEIPAMKFQDEEKLLKITIKIIEKLYLYINGIGYDFEGVEEISKKSAAELWSNCILNIKE